MQFCFLMLWIVILAFFFAKVEIHIEGGDGWAAKQRDFGQPPGLAGIGLFQEQVEMPARRIVGVAGVFQEHEPVPARATAGGPSVVGFNTLHHRQPHHR